MFYKAIKFSAEMNYLSRLVLSKQRLKTNLNSRRPTEEKAARQRALHLHIRLKMKEELMVWNAGIWRMTSSTFPWQLRATLYRDRVRLKTCGKR